jgi:hypothetical protein
VNQRDYLGTVEEVRLNERFAAVLSEGRVQLHFIEAGMDPSEEGDIIFPEQVRRGSGGGQVFYLFF